MIKWKYGLWLDDERQPTEIFKKIVERYFVAESYEDAIFYLANFTEDENYEDLFISFDHDLGEEKTGYDLAKYLLEHDIYIGGFTIHSMNPVGAKNIYDLLSHYDYKYWPTFGTNFWRSSGISSAW